MAHRLIPLTPPLFFHFTLPLNNIMKNVYVWKLVIASERVCPSLKMESVTIFCHRNIRILAKHRISRIVLLSHQKTLSLSDIMLSMLSYVYNVRNPHAEML
jgi:hypothetical protein